MKFVFIFVIIINSYGLSPLRPVPLDLHDVLGASILVLVYPDHVFRYLQIRHCL
jgi:hypothetical protein